MLKGSIFNGEPEKSISSSESYVPLSSVRSLKLGAMFANPSVKYSLTMVLGAVEGERAGLKFMVGGK